MTWVIERLDKTRHERGGFDCGKPPLNDFLQKSATQYEKRSVGRTYVATRPDEPRVMGYYTLATGGLRREDLPDTTAKPLPRHPVPVVLLARLAVDVSAQGQGLGAALLRDALSRVMRVAEQVGLFAVIVDAIDDNARHFYKKYGFAQLRESPLTLFLTVIDVIDGQA